MDNVDEQNTLVAAADYFNSANELLAHNRLSYTYPVYKQNLDCIRSSTGSSRALYTLVQIRVVDKIMASEGFDTTPSGRSTFSTQKITVDNHTLDWATLLRWATGLHTLTIGAWKIKRSKVIFDDAYPTWANALRTIVAALPDLRCFTFDVDSLQSLQPIQVMLNVLRDFMEESKQLVASPSLWAPSSLNGSPLAEIKWETISKTKRIMKQLAKYSTVASSLRRAAILSQDGQHPDQAKLDIFVEEMQQLNSDCTELSVTL